MTRFNISLTAKPLEIRHSRQRIRLRLQSFLSSMAAHRIVQYENCQTAKPACWRNAGEVFEAGCACQKAGVRSRSSRRQVLGALLQTASRATYGSLAGIRSAEVPSGRLGTRGLTESIPGHLNLGEAVAAIRPAALRRSSLFRLFGHLVALWRTSTNVSLFSREL